MAIHGYTAKLKLIKPEFDADTWHDYEYDNLDTIDAVLGTLTGLNTFKGEWANSTAYSVGDVITANNTMYIVNVEHTTDASSTFIEFWNKNPTYYEDWNGVQKSREWATKIDGIIEDPLGNDYSSKAYAMSEDLTDEGSAKEWSTKDEDIQIGATEEYSAKHYKIKTQKLYDELITDEAVKDVHEHMEDVVAVANMIPATEENYGIVKLASESETTLGIETGKVVTPAGLNSRLPVPAVDNTALIFKDGTTKWGKASAENDGITIHENDEQKLEVMGVLNKNPNGIDVKYDWIGTKQQWLDQNIATQHPEWIWLITDDYNEMSLKIDGQTINKNSNDELQAIGVKDNKNNSTHKLVVCTLAQYKAWKDAGQIDEDTDYDITDDVIPTESVEYPHIIDRHVDGVRGYTIWSDGYCEQWGYENAGAELREVSLMKTYRDTNYNIQLTIGFEGGTNVSLTISENSSYQKTGSKFYVYGHTALKCSWTTKGFLAEGQY